MTCLLPRDSDSEIERRADAPAEIDAERLLPKFAPLPVVSAQPALSPSKSGTSNYMTPAATAPAGGRRGVAVVLCAVLVGLLAPLLLSTGSASAAPGVPRRSAAEMRIAMAIRVVINNERARHHLRRVHPNWQLRLSARRHDVAMARADFMSHRLPGEADFGARMDAAGYHWTWAGENIGWNGRADLAGAVALETAMYNEHAPNDGHRRNILSPNFRNVGVDVYLDRAHHRMWLTIDFGNR